jgi:hypothetical protein
MFRRVTFDVDAINLIVVFYFLYSEYYFQSSVAVAKAAATAQTRAGGDLSLPLLPENERE